MKEIAFTDNGGIEYLFTINLKLKDILIYNISSDKTFSCPIDAIQENSDVFLFVVEYLDVSKDAKEFIEKIVRDEFLTLV